jgi:RNA polymerase sigma factor (sigma-70 family)
MSPSVSARLLLTQSDARLVAFARAGHERAFEALVRRYRGPLLGYCRRLLLSEERAEDALQQALMQAWLALRGDTEVQNAKAWLYRIVHNSALNALRVSGYDYCTLSESLSGADAPQEDLDRRIAVREALAGLAALPELQREALLRTAVEGSSHREAARELGVSEPALRGLVYRARATLRAAAGAFVPGPVVSWALGAGSGAQVGEHVTEVGIAGGGAGVAGLLMKGGAMAVTAGMLAGSIATLHVHRKPAGEHRARASVRRARVGTDQIALASVRVASSMPVTDGRRISAASNAPTAAHRPTSQVTHVMRPRHDEPLTSGSTPASLPAAPNPNPHDGGGGRTDRRDGRDETHEEPRGAGAGGADGGGADGDRSGRGDVRGGAGDHDGRGGHGRSGDGPGEGGDGSSGDGVKGSTNNDGHEGRGGDDRTGRHDGRVDQSERSGGADGDGESRRQNGVSEPSSSAKVTVPTTDASSGGESTPR